VSKGVPSDPFVDTQSSRHGKDMALHDRLRQVRPAALMHRTRKHPILWRFVSRPTMPLPQCLNQIIVSRDGFLGTFRLADSNNILND
jgi:hypothetical protein